jgi:hypothetical protein
MTGFETCLSGLSAAQVGCSYGVIAVMDRARTTNFISFEPLDHVRSSTMPHLHSETRHGDPLGLPGVLADWSSF